MPAKLMPFRIVFRASPAAILPQSWTRFYPDLAAAAAEAAALVDRETGGLGVLIIVQPTADPRQPQPAHPPARLDLTDFPHWRHALDLAFMAATGLDLRDLPDMPFYDWYEDGLTIPDAVEMAQHCAEEDF